MKKNITIILLLSSLSFAQESSTTGTIKTDTTGKSMTYVNGQTTELPLDNKGKFEKNFSNKNFVYAERNIEANRKAIRGIR